VNDADGLDPNKTLADMIAEFEAASGRTLQPAQVERLLINLYAYRESLVRNAIQFAAEQNLLAFASFPMIDYLGQLLGLSRLASQTRGDDAPIHADFCAHGAVRSCGRNHGRHRRWTLYICDRCENYDSGRRNDSQRGATATAPGAAANGYLPGQVNVQIRPSALIASVVNTTTTAGGSAPESDDHLRTRIQAAPNQFSVAGPVGAYRFFAISADPSIIDAQIISPAPGVVNAYVLTGPISVQPAASPNSAGVASASNPRESLGGAERG